MDVRPDRPPSTFSNPQLLSASLPPSQIWPGNSLAATFRARTRVFDTSAIDDPTHFRRAPTSRQLNGIPRPFQRKHRQAASTGSRSTLASQPVIVRTYSADTHEPPTMSQRPRAAGTNNSTADRPSAEIPQVQEFGIEGILRAIDPDIQDTLDAIAEICGRSKLSLANEYGSHRPPLGEIRAPARSIDHGLLTVEEASSSSERLVDDNIIIVGDDISTVDGRDHYSSTYGYLDSIHPTTRVMEYRNSMRYAYGERNTNTPQQQPESHRGATAAREPAVAHTLPSHPTVVRNHQAKSSLPYLASAFQASKTGSGSAERGSPSSMTTQPVISEVHLDAQAEGTYQAPEADPLVLNTPMHTETGLSNHSSVSQDIFWRQAGRLSMIPDVHGWLARLKGAGNPTEQAGVTIRSAEMQLREVLERQDLQLMQMPEVTLREQGAS